MQITAADRIQAVEKAFALRRVRWFIRRTPENERRVHQIQESVWESCEVIKARSNSKSNRDLCHWRLEREPYYETAIAFEPQPVQFIPLALLLQILLPILINLFIDLFLEKRYAPIPQEPD